MAGDELKVVWVHSHRGDLVPYHQVCAERLKLEASSETGDYYHTAICHACARWLDSPPEADEDLPPAAD